MIRVTAENRDQWVQRLSDANEALNKLMLGALEVDLSYNGEALKFNMTTEDKLRRWVAEIETALGMRAHARARSRRISY